MWGTKDRVRVFVAGLYEVADGNEANEGCVSVY